MRLADHSETSGRVDRVLRLVGGFESAYGLELRSTAHWLLVHGDAGTSAEVLDRVREWSRSKVRMFTPEHIEAAVQTLHARGWLSESVAV